MQHCQRNFTFAASLALAGSACPAASCRHQSGSCLRTIKVLACTCRQGGAMGKLGARGRSDGTASEKSFSNAAGSTIVLRDGALQHPESQGTQGKVADGWAKDKPRDTVLGSGLRGQGSDSKAAIQAANADGTVPQRPEVKQRPDEDLVLPKQVNPGRQNPQQQQQGQGLRQERPLPVKEQPEALRVVERPKKQQTPGKPGLPLDFDWQTYLLYNPELQQVSCIRLLPSAACRECPWPRTLLS